MVLTTRGQLEVRRSGAAQFTPLQVRRSLFANDRVRTGPNSKATLLFKDGAQVRLNANTTIDITQPKTVRGQRSLFQLVIGEVWSRLRAGQAITTSTGVAGVRGTQILMTVLEDGTSSLFVEEGEVEFYNSFGLVNLVASQQSIAKPGQAPTAPVTVQNGELILEWTLDLNRELIPREKYFVSPNRKLVQAQLGPRAIQAKQGGATANDHIAYGDVLFDARQFEAAANEYRMAAILARANPNLYIRLGYALLELNLLEEAEAVFRKAVPAGTGERDEVPGMVGLVHIALARGETAKAQRLAQQVLQADEAATEARLVLGVALMRQPKRLEEAGQVFDAVLRSGDNQYLPQAHAWLALVRLGQHDVSGALESAQSATKLAPDSAMSRASLALVLFYAARPREAETEARRALELNPDMPAARVALGQALLAQGKAEEAEELAAQAVALDPDLPQARYLLGVANASRRDYPHAVRELKASLELAPEFLPAASTLARVYNLMGRPDEATATINALLPVHRDTHAVQGALGEVLYEQGRYRESATQYRNALVGNTDSALYNAGLARALVYSNQLSAAIEAGQKAVSLAPTVGEYHTVLGLAYEFSGLEGQAEREYRTALTLEPRNAVALAQLAYRHEGSDLRPAAASFTQSFLLNPAVSNRLLRGGVNTEVTPTSDDNSQQNVGLTHRTNASEGRFHSFSFLNRSNEGGFRPNDSGDGYDLAEFATLNPNPNTNIYLNLRGQLANRGLPGRESFTSTDDNASFRYGQAQLAARQQLREGQHLWVGLFGNTSRHITRDPDLNSFFDAPTELPISEQRFRSHAVQPELRYDLTLNDTPERSSFFTAGLAHARTRFNSRRELAVGAQNGTSEFQQTDKGLMAYAQMQQRWGRKFSLIGQLRWQDLDRDRSALLRLPNQADQAASSNTSDSLILPSLLATYQADRRTMVRFALNRRQTDVTTSTFAPTETLLTTERTALPFGTADRMRLAQLDIERYISSRDFIKLFIWQTTARDVQIGGSDLLGFGGGLPAADAPSLLVNRWQGYGIGARYERRLTNTLFADLGVFARRTNNESRGLNFDRIFSGQRAPYEPALQARAALNYIDRKGNKAGVRLRYNGSYFADSPLAVGRPRFPERVYLDLMLAREPSVNYEFFVRMNNVFNTRELQFLDFRSGQRRVEFGATRRF